VTTAFILAGPDRRTFILSGSAAIADLFLAGCSPGPLIGSLEAVVIAAEAAIPIIAAAAGLPPQTTTLIVGFLELVLKAADQATTILAGPGTTAEKSAAIIAAFSNLAQGCNCLPAGTPEVVVNVIDAIAKAIAQFLTHFAPKPGLTGSAVAPVIKIGRADRAALAKIRTRAEQNMSKLKDLKK